jgi:hypothetical protein
VALLRHEPHDDTPGNFGRRINTAFVCMGTVSWSGHFVRMRWCIITIQLRVQYSHCAASFAVSVRPGFPQSSVAANHQSLGWQAVGLYSKPHHSPRQSNCDKPGLSASVISEYLKFDHEPGSRPIAQPFRVTSRAKSRVGFTAYLRKQQIHRVTTHRGLVTT